MHPDRYSPPGLCVPWGVPVHDDISAMQVLIFETLAAQKLDGFNHLAPNHGDPLDRQWLATASVLFIPRLQRVGLWHRGGEHWLTEAPQSRGWGGLHRLRTL